MSSIAWLRTFLLIGLVIAPTYCQPGHSNINHDPGRRGHGDEQVRREIEAMNDMFVHFVRTHDQAGVESMYADDVIALPDGYPPVHGLKTLAPTLAWVQHVQGVEVQVMDIEPLDETAEFVFEWKMTQTIGADGRIVYDGKSVIIWKRTESGYKIYIEIYNKNHQ